MKKITNTNFDKITKKLSKTNYDWTKDLNWKDWFFHTVDTFGLIILDKRYTILFANKGIEKWINISSKEIIGENALSIFHGKNWICPHCVSEATFDSGNTNILIQKVNEDDVEYYAELTAYPIRDISKAIEACVVFIQDITDRMICHDEILRLYNEVTQTKEYLEGIIENSADAIVTSDLNGIITSWNTGAEKIYRFTKEEAIGQELPFVPEFLRELELEHFRRVKNGEVLKRLETLRMRKDGSIITVTLTLSPIKNFSGDVIGISGISRDITEMKDVQNELVRRNQELSHLFFISSAMRGTLELKRLMRMVLTAVTMGDGLGFNRAILFLVDEADNVLKGAMGVGPKDYDEACQIWDRLTLDRKTLPDLMRDIEIGLSRDDSFFSKLSISIEIPLTDHTILTKAVKEKVLLNVEDVLKEPLSDAVLIQQLGTQAYAVVPLISRDRVLGVLWVDNYFNKRAITEEDMRFLTAFSNQMASAIDNAQLFEWVKLAEQELENIFESISDMVYFVTEDYVIKSINKAVSKRLGKLPEEIIGKKCHEVFHGSNKPWSECPHHKTVEQRKAFVEEVEDQHLGGTLITSSSPIFDTAGKFIGAVNVVKDITEIKQLRENLLRIERELAFRAAHKIGNPLYSLETELLTLKKRLDKGNYNVREIIDAMKFSIEKSKRIIKDLKSLTKAEEISIANVDIIPLIKNSLRVARQKNVKVDFRLIEKIPKVLADPFRLTECFDELIANALKWFNKDENRITIRVEKVRDVDIPKSLIRKRGYLKITISDNGQGIPNANKDKIFDPFFTEDKLEGSGLGLAVVKRNIESAGGFIHEVGKFGDGAKFEIFLATMEKEEE